MELKLLLRRFQKWLSSLVWERPFLPVVSIEREWRTAACNGSPVADLLVAASAEVNPNPARYCSRLPLKLFRREVRLRVSPGPDRPLAKPAKPAARPEVLAAATARAQAAQNCPLSG